MAAIAQRLAAGGYDPLWGEHATASNGWPIYWQLCVMIGFAKWSAAIGVDGTMYAGQDAALSGRSRLG